MARLPPITAKDQVPAKDHAVFDSIVASRGAVQGPFTMFLHAPEVSERVAHLGAYVRFEGSLDMRVRVLAAMTAAREFEAVYVWGAQTGGARRQGVPEMTIAAIRDNHSRGIPPEDAQALQKAGVAAIYTPKDFDLNRIMADIVRIVERNGVKQRGVS